jgi:hypothetical protein
MATVVEGEQTVRETTVPHATLAPLAGTGLGGEDVVMVPVDDGSAPSLLVVTTRPGKYCTTT